MKRYMVTGIFLCVALIGTISFSDEIKLPKYTGVLYSGSQIVENFETDSVEAQNSRIVKFITSTGQEIVIINDCIVLRTISKEDQATLLAQREKTQKMQKLLTLKRQEVEIKKEIEAQQKLSKEISEIEVQKPEKKVTKE